MSSDQGAWDAITRLNNEKGSYVRYGDTDWRDQRIEALEKRVVDLERRFRELKKVVWRV